MMSEQEVVNLQNTLYELIPNKDRTAYGILAPGGIQTPYFSCNTAQLQQIVDCFNREKLEPIHFRDVCADILWSALHAEWGQTPPSPGPTLGLSAL